MLKELDRAIVRNHGDVSDMLASCHVGLGARMLVELGYDPDEVAALVARCARDAADGLPDQRPARDQSEKN